jgi:hypothetical protein
VFRLFTWIKRSLISGSAHAVEAHYCCEVCKEDVIEQSGDIQYVESIIFSSYENLQYVSDILVPHQLKQCSNQPTIVITFFASISISYLACSDSSIIAEKDSVYLARCLTI